MFQVLIQQLSNKEKGKLGKLSKALQEKPVEKTVKMVRAEAMSNGVESECDEDNLVPLPCSFDMGKWHILYDWTGCCNELNHRKLCK
jgi:hypothetical protein